MPACLSLSEIAAMIDLSAVRADSCKDDVIQVAVAAKTYGCVAAFVLPGFTPLLRDLLNDDSGAYGPVPARKVALGGVVGFPSGGNSTRSKVEQAKECLDWKCDEVDMVLNIGYLRSGMSEEVEADIRAVKETIRSIPLKVILECHYLTREQIIRATELIARAGADWVKTATGWAKTGATTENIALIKSVVGDFPRIKAAGGVRDLDSLLLMHELGAQRFGIGYASAKAILEDAAARLGENS